MFEIAAGILLAGAALVALVLFWPIIWRLAAIALVLSLAAVAYFAVEKYFPTPTPSHTPTEAPAWVIVLGVLLVCAGIFCVFRAWYLAVRDWWRARATPQENAR